MKTNPLFNLMLITLFIGSSSLLFAKGKSTFTSVYSESYTVSSDASIDLDNRFGNIEITTSESNKVEVEVQVNIDAKNEEQAEKMQKQIKIEFSNASETPVKEVSVQTVLKGKFTYSGNNPMEIIYKVKAPRSCNFKVKNKFGDVILTDLDGEADLHVEYGAISGTRLNHDENDIDLSFGKGSFQYIKSANLDIRYSEMSITEAKKLDIDSEFSTKLNIGHLENLNIDSRYDNVEIESIGSLDIDCQFSTVNIENLSKSLNMDCKYGSLKIETVASSFSSINIDAQFTGMKIGLAQDVSCKVNADMQFASLKSPSSSHIKYEEDSHTAGSYHGWVGKEGGNQSIDIDSSYGNVDLHFSK